MNSSALARLVSETGEFLTAPPEQPFSWKIPDASLLSKFSLRSIDGLLQSGLDENLVRIIYKNGRVAKSSYANRASSHGVLAEEVSRYLQRGATLVIDELARIWAPLGDFCRRLSSELSVPVDATSFLTPAGKWGLDFHYDVHSVLLMQTSGSKRWRLQPPSVKNPLPSQVCKKHGQQEGEVMEFILREGDALWIPRGWYHAGVATEEHSLHVTFWFPHLTRYWIAQQILKGFELEADELLPMRDDIFWGVGFDPSAVEKVIRNFKNEFADHLRLLKDSDLTNEIWRSRMSEFGGPHRKYAASSVLEKVDVDTQLQLLPEAVLHIEYEKGDSLLYTGEGELRFPRKIGEMIARMRATGAQISWAVKDLDDREMDAIKTAKILMQFGLAEIAEES
ncbi:cupin domain-containing protein [Streptomyces sp. NPDC001833]|uniref:JmjC domain-containing protein n=1 Tax=Streptomyces sp. NPDC001833 TaxID=3154658 RepID=UPI003325A838